MSTLKKIQDLWDYFGLQDDETLIVRHTNPSDNSDEYVIAKMTDSTISLYIKSNLTDEDFLRPFQKIEQRNSQGRFEIPSVNQLKTDAELDY